MYRIRGYSSNNISFPRKKSCVMKKNIIITSSFGHEIMACNFAKAYGVKILIAPKKDNKEEYAAEAERILRVMSFFYDKMEIVPFEEKDNIDVWDVIAELKAGTLPDEVWNDFFKVTLTSASFCSGNTPESIPRRISNPAVGRFPCRMAVIVHVSVDASSKTSSDL